MHKYFKDYIDELPTLMRQLKNSKLRARNELDDVTYGGIYVFYDTESRQPVYVGRSNDIKQRIQFHSRPSSGHGSATFAFILAKENVAKEGMNINIERKILEKEALFSDKFRSAKLTVSKMLIRVVEVDDPILQTLLEVYAAVELKTKYNDFSNH